MSPSPAALDLHRDLVAAGRTLREAEHALAALLARMHDGGFHLELGYASVRDYAVAVLDPSPRKAVALQQVGRAMAGPPALDAAFADGRLTWTKARELLRVVTPDTEAAWVDRAGRVSSRQLEDDLADALHGEPPPTHVGTEPSKRPAHTRLVFERVATVDAELVRDALGVLRSRLGADRDDVSDGELLAALAQRFLHGLDDDDTPTAERWRIVVQQCPLCGRTEGPTAALADPHVGMATCDGEVADGTDGPQPGHVARTIPPAVRREVVHRDGRSCRVPGCTNRLWFDLHHVVSRADGGGNDPANLLCVCATHHRLIHKGRLAVRPVEGGVAFTFPHGREVVVALVRRATPPAPASDATSADAPDPAARRRAGAARRSGPGPDARGAADPTDPIRRAAAARPVGASRAVPAELHRPSSAERASE